MHSKRNQRKDIGYHHRRQDPQNLNRYVLLQYDNEPYPGVVIDCDDDEVYVRCMHRVGRDLELCSFYWPKAVKDECWYSIEDVLK